MIANFCGAGIAVANFEGQGGNVEGPAERHRPQVHEFMLGVHVEGEEPPMTTETIAAAYQLILPGECAPAHRHTPFALRFIVEGTG